MSFRLDVRDEVGNSIGDYRNFENHRAVVKFLDENSKEFRPVDGLWTDIPFWDGMTEHAFRVLYLERFFDVTYWTKELDELQSVGCIPDEYQAWEWEAKVLQNIKDGGKWINSGTCIYWLRYEDKTTG